jgi:hypothetical protein
LGFIAKFMLVSYNGLLKKYKDNKMKEIMGIQYLTEKEAANRYGYSQSWFMRGRIEGFGPNFVQIKNHGRVLYPLEETDKWFKERMRENE